MVNRLTDHVFWPQYVTNIVYNIRKNAREDPYELLVYFLLHVLQVGMARHLEGLRRLR